LERGKGTRAVAHHGGDLARPRLAVGLAGTPGKSLREIDARTHGTPAARARAMAELGRLDHGGGRPSARELECRREPGIAAAHDRDVAACRRLDRALGIRPPRLPPIGHGFELGMEDVARHGEFLSADAGFRRPLGRPPLRYLPHFTSSAPRPKRCAMRTASAIRTICRTDTAAIVGSISMRMLSNIFFGNVISEPARNMATTSSSKEVTKARSAAETRLGRICGSVTRLTACQRLAPSPSAAASRASSKPRS